MKIRVGIPGGLFFYQFFPMWKTFFEELGAELVVSSHTTAKILDDGIKACVDEACLPVKVFYGHVLSLKDRVEYLFIPRFTSISRDEYICPKFGGLPDMIRSNLSGLPEIIDTEINLRKSKKNSIKSALEIGSKITSDKRAVISAYEKALTAYYEYRSKVRKGALPSDILDRKLTVLRKSDDGILNIMVIGHAYNLYDSYINLEMIKKLRDANVNAITVDMIDSKTINEKTSLLNKRMFWNFGRRAMGSALHALDRSDIDGIIYVMSFGCGVDSFVSDLIEKRIRRKSDLPFIMLTIDEHSGEAGMNTRLEAFIDMIRWRCKDEADISTYG